MRALLDVNVWVALLDPLHLNHQAAHAWFLANRDAGWASCPTTLLGCLRILAHPSYQAEGTLAELAQAARAVTALGDHEYWVDAPNPLDPACCDLGLLRGHQQLTDALLLATAVAHGGRLVTFDRSMPVRAVKGATADHVLVLGG